MEEPKKEQKKSWVKRVITFVSPWIVLVALLASAVYFGSQALAEWHYNEFIAPFLK